MRSRTRQRAAGEVVLMTDVMGRLTRVCKGLLRMRMRLSLEFGNLHAKSLMGLTAIHEDMLPLMGLSVHGKGIQGGCLGNRRRSRRRWSVVAKL